MTATSTQVGMAEIQAIKGPGVFTALSVGGGIVICAIDPVANVAGCAHFVLPSVVDGKVGDRPGKHGQTAIPELLAMLERLGAQRSQILATALGGTQFFKVGGEEAESSLDVGFRNSEAAKELLAECGVKLVHSDFGGNHARNVTFSTEGGEVFVRSQGGRDKLAVNLRRQAVRI